MPRLKAKKEFKPMDILIGADPELFAFNYLNEAVSVHDLLPGTKASPLNVPKGAIQVDGVAAEFNINPAKNRKEFLFNIQHVQNLMSVLLRKQMPGLILKAEPTAWFTKKYLDSLPVTATILGCEPDFNAYTGEVQPKPDASNLFRTGAGHIHVGWTTNRNPQAKTHFTMCRNLVKELDFGLWPQSKMWDSDQRRMDLYGKPGSFRPKSYGVEYRVLSNAWLRQVATRMFIYDCTRAISELFFKGNMPSKDFGKVPTDDYTGYVEFLRKVHIPYIGDYGIGN